jgi:Na+/phosphate symporter
LQAAFDGHGQDTTFDYIEHVNVSFAEISPQPSVALPFAFLLAVLAAMVTATVTCFLSIIGTATKSV